jgi:ankyrin repeat protein
VLKYCKFFVIFLVLSQTSVAQTPVDMDGFFLAVSDGRSDVVAALVKEHPEWIDQPMYLGIRPLYRAAVLGRSDVAQILIENGADLQATTDRGSLPLHAAAQNGHLAIVQMLIAARAEVNAVNGSGATALHLATRYKRDKVMTELLRNGADTNIRDKSGRTPLHFAAGLGRMEQAQELVEAGAEKSPVDKAGYSPLGWARTLKRNNFGSVAGWLEAAGGEDIRPVTKEKK